MLGAYRRGPQTRRRGNRALRDLKRRLGLWPKTASWPMPSLRFDPTGFAPPTDTNFVFTKHEQFRCSIGFHLTTIREERSCLATKSSRGRRCGVDVLLSSPVLCGLPSILNCIIQDRSRLKEATEEFNGEAKLFVSGGCPVRVAAACREPKAERARWRVAKVAQR